MTALAIVAISWVALCLGFVIGCWYGKHARPQRDAGPRAFAQQLREELERRVDRG